MFEFLMKLLRSADEPHGGHSVAPPVERITRRDDNAWIVSQAEVVIRAENEDPVPALQPRFGILRRCQHAFGLPQSRGTGFIQLGLRELLVRSKHQRSSSQLRMTLPLFPERMTRNPSSKSPYENRCVMTGRMSRPDWRRTVILYQDSYIRRP